MKTFRYQLVPTRHRNGLTLVELVIVLTILVAIAGLVTPRLMSTADSARDGATHASAVEIRDAVMRFWSDCKYEYPSSPIEDQRIQVGQLLEQPAGMQSFNPDVGLGWRGPYLQADGRRYIVDSTSGFTTIYGDTTQSAIRDAFTNQDYDGDGNEESGSPFVIQEPTLRQLDAVSQTYELGQPREVRVVSAGPNGILEISEALFAADLDNTPSLQGDDIYVTFVLR